MRLAPHQVSETAPTSENFQNGEVRRNGSKPQLSPRLQHLRQRRKQQKQRVQRLLKQVFLVSAIALPLVAISLPASRQAIFGEVQHTVEVVADTFKPRVSRSRSNLFVETALQDLSPQVRALLDTIAFAEGTHDELGYQTIFTFDTFGNFFDHPRRIRCTVYAGQRLCSDAAGRYQMLSSTFDSVAKPLGLADFSPISQDLAAVELIRRRGGLEKIQQGDFEGALVAIQKEWSSLPGSGYGQPEVSVRELQRVYERRLIYYQQQAI
ncbi:MAG: glycoside hydrolase family 104 protein [Cyanobacteria bacterium SBC]|nr:glycoside hydrolase family 104 protein [Cyanobacteria bacterium SBC]